MSSANSPSPFGAKSVGDLVEDALNTFLDDMGTTPIINIRLLMEREIEPAIHRAVYRYARKNNVPFRRLADLMGRSYPTQILKNRRYGLTF